MHELSLVMHLLNVVEEQARQETFQRVSALDVEVGELAAVELEAFRHCFEVASSGTVAEGATLRLACIPGSACCRACAARFHLPGLGHPCPQCGSTHLEIVAGRELRLRALEVC